MAAHAPSDPTGEQAKVGSPSLAGTPSQRQVGRGIGNERIVRAEAVVAMARPRPVSGALNNARPDRIQVAVEHHLEFVAPAVLNPGRPEALHHDLTTAPGPPIGPSREALVDDLPERAERGLAAGRSTDHVRVRAHQAVAADVDPMSVLVLREKPEEFPSSVVGVEDRGAVVASPEAVMCGPGAYESRAWEARHEVDESKRRAVSRPRARRLSPELENVRHRYSENVRHRYRPIRPTSGTVTGTLAAAVR
jgi:hypothetical protein